MADARDAHDSREAYCRRLGHHLKFGYCRSPGTDEPCSLILDCWYERFDVATFMAEHYPQFVPRSSGGTPQPKVVTLFELIQRAQEGARG